MCDDDPADRKRYADYIEKLSQKYNIPIKLTSYQKGEALLFDVNDPKVAIDILFMDINMPDENGISVTKKIRQMKEDGFSGEIIFLTFDEKYAFEAFDVEAFHYIVKNKTSLEKFEEILLAAVLKTQEKNRKQLLLKGIGEYRRIDIDSIQYFEIYKRIVTVYYGNPTQTFEFYSTMEKIEEALLAFRFLRVHRSYLVNTDYIEIICRQEMTLRNQESIPIGRSYYDKVKKVCEALKQ